jgi:hypothetical protein
MPKYYSSSAPNPAAPLKNSVDLKGCRLRLTPSNVAAADITTMAINDQIVLARIPSNCRLVDYGKISYGAFGGTSAVSLGFDHAAMTVAERAAAINKLWNAQSIVAAGSRNVMAGVALADLGKRAWQLAGLTKDPGGELDVVMTFTTAGTTAQPINSDVTFITD